MLPSCSRATAQNVAEFAENPEMCTPKLEKSCTFTIFTVVWHVNTTFCMFLQLYTLTIGRLACWVYNSVCLCNCLHSESVFHSRITIQVVFTSELLSK